MLVCSQADVVTSSSFHVKPSEALTCHQFLLPLEMT